MPATFVLAATAPAGTAIESWNVSSEGASVQFWQGGYRTGPPATLDHTFTEPGTYTVSLRVLNNLQTETVSTVQVTVIP